MGASGRLEEDAVALEAEGRRIAWRVLLVALAIILASSPVARGIGWVVDQVGRSPTFFLRLRPIVRDLPALVARDEKAIIAIGSSLTQMSILPQIFEEEMQAANRELGKPIWPVVLYNLGVIALPPNLERAILHRVVKEYRAAGRRPAGIILDVTPLLLTWNDVATKNMEIRLIVEDFTETLERVWHHPDEGLRQFGRRYLMGGRSGPYITWRMQQALDLDVPVWFGDETRDEYLHRQYWSGAASHFTLETRGSPLVPKAAWDEWIELTREIRAAELKVPEWEGPYREAAVLDMIASVKEAHEATDEVFLLILPSNPCGVVPPPSFDEEGLRLVERIRREGGGGAVIDLSGFLPCGDFIDGIHPDLFLGAPKLSREIARKIAAVR